MSLGGAKPPGPVRYRALTLDASTLPASSLHDRDLISIQETSEAQKKFAAFSQEQVDAVVEACAEAATAAAEQLARTAVEETGYGNVPDKIIKNQLASVEVPRAIRGMKTVGIVRQ